ncbi:MAG TPA: hypothetical protein VKE94_06275, partial [Gemmataceae bacterium]|nr:hypothetical protein [Gemmataceae bacterium]
PDDKTLVIGQDTVIHFYDLTSGREVRQFKSSIGGTDGLTFSPDGMTLASGHGGDAVLLWDVVSGKELAKLPAKHNRTGLLTFSPDGKTLATGDTLDKTIRLFDVETRKERNQLTRPSFVHDMSFSPDGTVLAAGGDDGTIPLWDVASGKLLREMRSPFKYVHSIAWSPDSKMLAASDYDEKNEVVCLRLWEPATGKEMQHVRTGGVLVRSLAFTADSKTLVAGDGSVVRLWNVANGEEQPPVKGNDAPVWALALSPDGRTLAYSGMDVHLWDVAEGREVGMLPGHHWSFAFSPDGKTLAGGSNINAINLWDVPSRQRIRTLTTDMEKIGAKWVAFRRAAFAPDGKILATCGDGYRDGARSRDEFVHFWDPSTGKELRRLEFKDDSVNLCTVENVTWSPDGRTLICSGRAEPKAGTVRAWDTRTGKDLSELTAAINSWFPTWKDSGRIQSPIVEPRVVFSPTGWLLSTNCVEKSIPVWEAATGRERCRLEGHDGPTCCVAFAPDGCTIASAGYDHTIRLWNVETGKELRKLIGHRGRANALVFSPDGKTLISGGDDTTVLIWDVAGVTKRERRVARLASQEWETLWKALTGSDAVQAHQAIAGLTAAPNTATMLKERLKPALKLDAARLEQLIRDLDSDEFTVRDKATRAIEKLGESARPAIELALARPVPSPELHRRLERLQQQSALPVGEALRELRAVELLEHVATHEARGLLESLAKGAPEARLTREAKAALERLARRR